MASAEPEGVKPPPPAAEPEAAVAVEEKEKAVEEPVAKEEVAAAPPPPETKALASGTPESKDYFRVVDVVLRVLLFAASLVATVVLGTSKQTKLVSVPVPTFPPRFVPALLTAKFTNSPALIYFIAAFSVCGFYSLITALLSIFALLKPASSPKLLSHFVIFDVLLLGIIAAATGAGGAVGYIGYKGESHANWNKICNTYGTFCKHIASSLAFGLFGSVLLTLLVLLSIYSLSKKIPK